MESLVEKIISRQGLNPGPPTPQLAALPSVLSHQKFFTFAKFGLQTLKVSIQLT